jgi:hypothetical protein
LRLVIPNTVGWRTGNGTTTTEILLGFTLIVEGNRIHHSRTRTACRATTIGVDLNGLARGKIF